VESLLPDLPEPEKQKRFGLLRSLRDNVGDMTSGDVGPVDYDINTKRLQLQTRLRDALITGKIKPTGDWSLNVEKPLFGGTLNFDANGGSGDPNYYLQWNKRF
jgi:hypothetical protein